MATGMKSSWFGKAATAAIQEAAAEALYPAAEYILGKANETSPIDEGTLRRSGDTSVDLKKRQAAVSYDTPYAVKLHEDEGTNFSNKHARRKWFERTLEEQGEAAFKIIANHVKGGVSG